MTYSTTHKASELTLLEKVSSLLFGEVEAEAWSCWRNMRSFFWGWHWWGFRVRANTCWGEIFGYYMVYHAGMMAVMLKILGLGGVVGWLTGLGVSYAIGLLKYAALGIKNTSRVCRNGGWATADVKFWGVEINC